MVRPQKKIPVSHQCPHPKMTAEGRAGDGYQEIFGTFFDILLNDMKDPSERCQTLLIPTVLESDRMIL
jgi:hypothetical protein